MNSLNRMESQGTPDPVEFASAELLEFNIDATPDNIEAVLEQQRTKNHPEGYDDILDNLDNPDALKAAMEARGITSMTHAEGRTVWDHVKTVLREIDSLQVSEERKTDLRLIILYHDLGKTVSPTQQENIDQTQKHLAKGRLHQSMIGHAKERWSDMEAGLQSNGVSDGRRALFMKVIEHHMDTSLLEQDPKKTVKLFETFGADYTERQMIIKLLVQVLQVDGNGTHHIDLHDGALHFSKNEKKLALDFASVWGKYEEGKKLLAQEEVKKQQEAAVREFEQTVFGKKLSDYLIQDRGVQQGPGMKEPMRRVKQLLGELAGKPPAEIRALIDAAKLE